MPPRILLTCKQKMEIIQANEIEKCSVRKLAERFKIGKTQAAKILKNKEGIKTQWQSGSNINGKRFCLTPQGSQVDKLCCEWYAEARAKNISISGPMVKAKAMEIAQQVGYSEFAASDGWLQKWRTRHNINFKRTSPLGAPKYWNRGCPSKRAFTEKLVFRLNEPEQQKIQLPVAETFASANDEEHDDQAPNGQFESVYLGKTEIRESQLNDSNESHSYEECQPEGSEFAAGGDVTANSTTSTYASPNPNPTNQDDAFFLQYLANKFSKYSANTKNTVQFHINRILYKADMGCYETVDASKISETEP